MKKNLILSLILMTSLMLMVVGSVSAAHTATVEVSPEGWLKEDTEEGYVFTITKDSGTDINWVKITKPEEYIDITCDDAPEGWTNTPDGAESCIYYTTDTLIGDPIDFQVNATSPSDFDEYTWLVVTKDLGEGLVSNNPVSIVKTIQSAIDADTTGTVTVPSGTYTEDLDINKQITLQSENGKDSTTIQLIGGGIDDVGIDFQGGAGGSILGGASGKGFTILGGASTTFNIQLTNAPSDVEISYNIIDTSGNPSMGISIGDAGASDLTISNNDFIAETDNGWSSDGSIWGPLLVNVDVSDNTFTGSSSGVDGGYAVQFSGVTGTSVISDNVIDRYGQGIAIFHGEGVSGLTISNNEISNSNNGIRFGHYKATGGADGDMTTVTVMGNILSNNDLALRIHPDGTNVLVSQFTIEGNQFIDSTTFAVKNEHSTEQVNATNNWWGTAIESEILGNISGDVDYDPWCYDAECSADTTTPTIEFDGEPYFALAEEEVTIEADISDDRDLASFILYFGDGENVTGEFSGDHNLLDVISESHEYATEGEYIVTLTVTDATENSQTETTVVVVNSEEPNWIIPLYADEMNLISIPLVPESTYYKDILEGVKSNLDRIWSYTYNEATKENEWHYQYTTSTGKWTTSTGADLNYIVPGYGYIVFMKNDDVLYGNARTISGDPEDTPMIPSSVKLANGYNLIGRYGLDDLSTYYALSSLRSGLIKYWHKVLNVDWEEVTLGSNLEPGVGYWISMKHLPDTATEDYYTYYL